MATQIKIGTTHKFKIVTQPDGSPPDVTHGVPIWRGSDEGVGKVTPAADGLTAKITAISVGTLRVMTQVNTKVGEEFNTLEATLELKVIDNKGETVVNADETTITIEPVDA